MTAQAYDTIRLAGERWALVGAAGTIVRPSGATEQANAMDLFRPRDHGIEPVFTSTANWRGYQSTLEVRDGVLVLATVTMGLAGDAASEAANGTGPVLFGKLPRRVGENGPWSYDLGVQVPFTGKLTLAKDLIQSLYEHMGYQDIWKFARVVELDVAEGRVEGVRDESRRWEEFRRTQLGPDGRPLPPPPPMRPPGM